MRRLRSNIDNKEACSLLLSPSKLEESSTVTGRSGFGVCRRLSQYYGPGKWLRDEELPFISQCRTSDQAHAREHGSFVSSPFSMHRQWTQRARPGAVHLFSKLFQDPESSDVCIALVRSLGVLAQQVLYISSDDKCKVQLFQQLLPEMFLIVKDRLTLARRPVFDSILAFLKPFSSSKLLSSVITSLSPWYSYTAART